MKMPQHNATLVVYPEKCQKMTMPQAAEAKAAAEAAAAEKKAAEAKRKEDEAKAAEEGRLVPESEIDHLRKLFLYNILIYFRQQRHAACQNRKSTTCVSFSYLGSRGTSRARIGNRPLS
jgi:hypothetical protein